MTNQPIPHQEPTLDSALLAIAETVSVVANKLHDDVKLVAHACAVHDARGSQSSSGTQSLAHTHRLWRDLEFSARATTRRRANRWPTRFSHLVCVILQFLHELVSRGELAISQESGLIMVWPRSEDKSKKGSFLSFPHHFLLRCGTPHTHTQNFFPATILAVGHRGIGA
jgi:hypothetical protein